MFKRFKKMEILPYPGQKNVSGYTSTSLQFAWVSSPESGRQQITNAMTCREYVNRSLWNHIADQHDNHNRVPSKFDLERLRLLVVYNHNSHVDEVKAGVFVGKALMNVIEQKMGWVKPSTVGTVTHKSYLNCWLITGPKEWMHTPQTLSIATLFLRLSAKFRSKFLSIDGFDEMVESMDDLYDFYNEMVRSDPDKENEDVATHLNCLRKDNLRVYLEHYDEIWKDMSQADIWPIAKAGDFRPNNGIYKFMRSKICPYSSKVEVVKERFRKIKEKRR
jgi:hypothetical protein